MVSGELFEAVHKVEAAARQQAPRLVRGGTLRGVVAVPCARAPYIRLTDTAAAREEEEGGQRGTRTGRG